MCAQARSIQGLQVLDHDTIDSEAARLSSAMDDWKFAVRFNGLSGIRADCYLATVSTTFAVRTLAATRLIQSRAEQRPQHGLYERCC